ncbi:MAG: outer spore coat protein CotE [Bacilli bacterium]
MAIFKEIVSRTILGKGKKAFTDENVISASEEVSTILGCWIINHTFSGRKIENSITIDGSYDVNIWYSHNGDTKTNVITKTINYTEQVNMRLKAEAYPNDTEVIIRSLSDPSCVDIKANGLNVSFVVKKELGIEVVGDAKIKVQVEEEEEPWDLIEDELEESEIDKQIEEINEDFLD